MKKYFKMLPVNHQLLANSLINAQPFLCGTGSVGIHFPLPHLFLKTFSDSVLFTGHAGNHSCAVCVP